MAKTIFLTQSYFDGEHYHANGPYTIVTRAGRILYIEAGGSLLQEAGFTEQINTGAVQLHQCVFLMPGLTEGHCHLFLDGLELDVEKRRQYLSVPFDVMVAVGSQNMAKNLAAGITLIRDGGDRFGINHHLAAEARNKTGLNPEIRSPGKALFKQGGYGGFIGTGVKDNEGILSAVHSIAKDSADLKILLTGIIDFEKGEVKGPIQFNLEEMSFIVKTARQLGLLTYAHCSGQEGLRIAVEAGVDSIEHGFFMNRDTLKAMADKQISWVPTFSPVYFQYRSPELAGWNEQTVQKLDAILQNHFECIALAFEMGVPVIAGSDAGSYGVPHGSGLIDELFFLARAGIPTANVLASATSVPRTFWQCESANIVPGNCFNFLEFEDSPFKNMENLRQPRRLFRNTSELSLVGEQYGV